MGRLGAPDEIADGRPLPGLRRRGVRNRHRVRDRRRPDRGLSVQALVTTPGRAYSTAVAEVADPRPGPTGGAADDAGGRRMRHRSRDLRGLLRGRTRRQRPARAGPRAARRGRAGRPRVRTRRPGGRDGAALLRPLRSLRRGLAGRVPHRRLLRARHHPARWIRQRPRRRVGRAPRGCPRLARPARRARGARLGLRAGDSPRPRRRRAPAVARRARPGRRHRRDRDARRRCFLRLDGFEVWTAGRSAGAQPEGGAGRGLRRALRVDGRDAARRSSRASPRASTW